MAAETGFLVLADISGFTAFVTATELEHGAEVTAALLDRVMHRLAPPLEIQELEGDAVFAIGPDAIVRDGRVLPVVLAEAFAAFKDEQRRLSLDESCSCGACRALPNLDLKVIAHHGRFVRQSVGGRSRVAGLDVILVHRLLKNQVDGSAYLLLTAPALARVAGHPLVASARPVLTSYAYFGDVRCFIAELRTPHHEGKSIELPELAAAAPVRTPGA